MQWSFSIGRLFGSELRVHVTFLILLGWIAISAWSAGGLPAAIWNVVFVLALFACVVAHEFGHALMARRYGIATPQVTLLPIGGVAHLAAMPRTPSAEIAVALAGPAVNVVIWLALTLVLGAEARLGVEGPEGLARTGFLEQLATVNLYLLVFNLLPAFPMDGGRVLRALLAMRMSRSRATRTAANVGRIMAVIFGLYGLVGGNPFLVLIAAFVFFAAGAESSGTELDEVARGLRAESAMISEFRTLSPDDSLRDAADAILATTQHEFPVTDGLGRPIGFLPRAAVFAAVSSGRNDARVGELMSADLPAIWAGAPLEQALEKMRATPEQVVMVVGRDGRLVGYVTRENIGELMLVRPPG